MQAFWGKYPGLKRGSDNSLDWSMRWRRRRNENMGAVLDLAVLPETAVTGETSSDVMADAVPLAGPLHDTFARKAREHHCYIVVPAYLLEDKDKKLCSNAAILFGRQGEVVGIYRKIHLAVPQAVIRSKAARRPAKRRRCSPAISAGWACRSVSTSSTTMDGRNWYARARNWWHGPRNHRRRSVPPRGRWRTVTTSSPARGATTPAIFEPTGRITAQIREPAHVLVQQIDLSYAILPWSSQLHNGAALREKYGDKAGYPLLRR